MRAERILIPLALVNMAVLLLEAAYNVAMLLLGR
jgi:hypothetical protein